MYFEKNIIEREENRREITLISPPHYGYYCDYFSDVFLSMLFVSEYFHIV